MRGWRFRQWYGEHADLVFSHACYCLGNRAEAQDVSQEVFMRLWEHMDRIDPARVRGWLLTVTHRACIDQIRKRGRTASTPGPAPDAEAHLMDPLDLEQQVGQRDVVRRILAHLGDLPDMQRSVLLLRFREELSFEEIADALCVSIENVRVLLHRGRRALRRAMQEVPIHG